MNRTLRKSVLQELRPDGIWQLSDPMRLILSRLISRLPKSKVSEDETRYPQSPAGMRAFLVKFFTRHYVQTQNSLANYMTSQDFLETIRSGYLRILDIGSGPAVSSLAITDMLIYILQHLVEMEEWPKNKTVKVNYVLNDTSSICLGTGKRILINHFNICRKYNGNVTHGQTISIQKAFPDNINQIRRIRFNWGAYDIVIFSYVVQPLNEDKGVRALVQGLSDIGQLCNDSGRILILQDKFQTALVGQISRAIGISRHEDELTQQVFPKRNTSETCTYSYYSCLYSPATVVKAKKDCVA